MRRKIHILVVLPLAMGLYGCSGVIYKEFSIDDSPATSLSVDARQRLIFVTHKGTKKHDQRVVCAEPSPDVAVAAAAALSAQVGRGKESAKVSGARSETLASITARTQTIQLLRDGLYRACEAYLNGAIDWREYKQMIMGFDQMAVTMLAIDGLTQAVAAPSVIIGSKASAKTNDAGETNAEPASPGNVVERTESRQGEEASKVASSIQKILDSYYTHQVTMAEKLTKLTQEHQKLNEERKKLTEAKHRLTEEQQTLVKAQARFKELELELEDLRTAKKPKTKKKKLVEGTE